MSGRFSIVIPAKNEEKSLVALLPLIQSSFPRAELIVVSDGSTDNTVKLCDSLGVQVIIHPYSKGNGAAIKTGVRAATCQYVVCMDADGQHDPGHILKLIESLESGFDMVVGARSSKSQASVARSFANRVYNFLASYIVNRPIKDLTSGFRAFERKKFLRFISLLPNGFSYPTTITMAFFRAGYSVDYIPIEAGERVGKSHINLLKDGIRFFMIIFKVGTLYSPLKIFFPLALVTFITGCSYYMYTYITMHRFTNMSAMLLINSLVIFLMGLISEQITTLLYQQGAVAEEEK